MMYHKETHPVESTKKCIQSPHSSPLLSYFPIFKKKMNYFSSLIK